MKKTSLSFLFCILTLSIWGGAGQPAASTYIFTGEKDEKPVTVDLFANPEPDAEGKRLLGMIRHSNGSEDIGIAYINGNFYIGQFISFVSLYFKYEDGRLVLDKSFSWDERVSGKSKDYEKIFKENKLKPFQETKNEPCSKDGSRYLRFESVAVNKAEDWYQFKITYVDGQKERELDTSRFILTPEEFPESGYCDEKTQIFYAVWAEDSTQPRASLPAIRAYHLKTGQIEPFLEGRSGGGIIGLPEERRLLFMTSAGPVEDKTFYFWSKPLIELEQKSAKSKTILKQP